MIIVKQEKIYGIDVYTFKSSQKTPYQLTFEKSLSGKYYDVSLLNLLGNNDSLFCKEIRDVVSKIALDYIIENNCTLFFNLEFSGKRGLLLLMKFLRWVRMEPSVIPKIEITTNGGLEYIEVYISLNNEAINKIDIA